MERAVLKVFQTRLTMPKLNVMFGNDAVAGAHGRNVEEPVYLRIKTPATEAVVSAKVACGRKPGGPRGRSKLRANFHSSRSSPSHPPC